MNRDTRLSSYAIAAVSKLTGVSCHALRVWERRHGFPRPERTESGHRRYSAEQVGIVRWIAAGLKNGRELSSLMEEVRVAAPAASEIRVAERGSAPAVSAAVVDALLGGDPADAEQILTRESAKLEPAEIVEQILEPAWIEAGDRLFRGLCGLGEERLAGEFLRRKLIVMLDHAKQRNLDAQGRVVLATLLGDRHEGGLLMLAIHLELIGWEAIILGTEVPAVTLADAVERFEPAALGISFILSRNIRKRFAELSRVEPIPIFVGGRSMLNYQSLARRHGLIPLPGPARQGAGSMIARIEHSQAVDARSRRRSPPG